jgi:hypothetical protein
LAEVEITSVISEARVEPIDTWWCKMSIIINENVLLYNGTCPDERKRFMKEFPDGLELTVENLDLARSKGFQIWLPGVYLYKVDLTGADLTEADLTGANLSRANLSRADLTGAKLTGANLTEADLTGANLGDWERGSDGFARRKSTCP